MAQVKAKVYYDTSTSEVILITPEMEGFIEETTKEEDFKIYSEFKDKNINDVDFIELEYGTLATIFTNIKSYSINLETKTLNLMYYTEEELQTIHNQEQENQGLSNRVADISEYLNSQSIDTISTFENYILQTEINKITEGMN